MGDEIYETLNGCPGNEHMAREIKAIWFKAIAEDFNVQCENFDNDNTSATEKGAHKTS